MVNNIVYFGRIIATILLIRLISLICLIASLPSLQGRAGVRLYSCQPLSRYSRATLVPLQFLRFLRLPSRMDSRLRKPDSLPVFCMSITLDYIQLLPDSPVFPSLETLETHLPNASAKILQKSVMCSFNGENFSKKMYFLRFLASS